MKLPPDHDLFSPWAPVPLEGYARFYWVALDGRIWSLRAGKELSPGTAGRNLRYRYVNLRVGGRQRNAYVHRLVATAFIGPAPEPGYHVDHIDRDPGNNHVSNLRWTTPEENLAARGSLVDAALSMGDPFV